MIYGIAFQSRQWPFRNQVHSSMLCTGTTTPQRGEMVHPDERKRDRGS